MSGGSLVDRLVPDSDEEESMVFQNSPPSLFPEGLACTRSQALDRILGESSEEECARCRKEWSEGWVPQGVQLDEEDGQWYFAACWDTYGEEEEQEIKEEVPQEEIPHDQSQEASEQLFSRHNGPTGKYRELSSDLISEASSF